MKATALTLGTVLVLAAQLAPAASLKVAIAGGGVGGLTAALNMLKAGYDVTLYEKTGKFARFGGPIQFASNALSTLKASLIDLSLREDLHGPLSEVPLRAHEDVAQQRFLV